MTGTSKEYRDFLTRGFNNSERLMAEYKAFRSTFYSNIERLLGEYGLRARLEAAKAAGQKLRFLHVECGEGLFLYDLATLLEKAGLLEAADLYGIDSAVELVEVANQFKLAAKPPRPYLNFYPKDYRQPLLSWTSPTKSPEVLFDVIYGVNSFYNVPNAKNIIKSFYQGNLKPDGLLLTFDCQLAKNWQLPHPAFSEVLQASLKLLASLNNGADVAEEFGGWLQELGAEEIRSSNKRITFGGTDEIGKSMMRNLLIGLQNPVPLLIQQGLLTQKQYDDMQHVIYQELTTEHIGYINYITTIGRKPA